MKQRARDKLKRTTGASDRTALVVTWATLGVVTLLSYGRDLLNGLSNDDFILLNRVQSAPFLSLFGWNDLLVGWFRPWSRELHFWTLWRTFGGWPGAYHGANLLIWLGVLAALLVLLNRLAGARVAVIAACGAVATSAWGIYLVWASCSQDLWMLLFGLLFLIALDSGRTALGLPMLALALLSKETAVLLIPVAVLLRLAREGRAGIRRFPWLPIAVVSLAWALVHPSLGGRWLFGSGVKIAATESGPLSFSTFRVPLALLNLEWWPAPRPGWIALLPECVAWAAGLAALIAWSGRRSGPATAAAIPRRRLVALGLGWWAIVWSVLLLPSLKWHSYYGWLGICGAWLAIGTWLAPRPRLAIALVLAIAALRPFEARTLIEEWATEEYQRVAAERLQYLQAQLLAVAPTLPPHSRVYLAGLPGGMGFRTGPGYSDAMHVWYRDKSVQGTTFSDYAPRAPGAPAGPDLFFVADAGLRLYPVASAPVPVPYALRSSEVWRIAEEQMANTFADFGEWSRAGAGYARLASAFPDTARHAFNVGVCYARIGDTATARAWLNRADSLSGSPPREGQGYLARVHG